MATIAKELTPEQERLIIKFNDFARNVAAKTYQTLPRGPSFTIEDAIQDGREGLIQAALRFDIEKNDPTIADLDANFKSFAYRRIKGAVIDAARKRAFVRRRGIEKGLDFKMIPFDAITTMQDNEPTFQLADIEADPDLIIDFEAALKGLSDREKFVVLSIGSGATGLEIATELGVTESRVSQIATEAKRRMKEKMAA